MLCRTYFGQGGSGYCHKAATDMRQKRDTLITGGMVLGGPTVGPLEASSCSSGPTVGPPRKLPGKRSEVLSGRTLEGSKMQWPPDGPDLGLGSRRLAGQKRLELGGD